MRALVVVVVLGVVAVNAFGAWAVSRRRPDVSRLFLLSAVVLVVAAVAVGYGLRFAAWILGGGLLLAWLTSYLNARRVLGRVIWRYHLLRGLALAALMVLGLVALR
ncbi:MAG TPA: hypothetical protein VKB31_10470 [Trueperaceae bacterium]|nr:hypothetical protein [Trueperaceae bacterium]